MIILINKDDLLDFEAPVFMTDEQLEKFTKGLKKIFDDVIIHKIQELDREPSEDIHRHPKFWVPEELIHLLSDKSHEEVANFLKREPFSVKSKRGIWILPFKTWSEKNGYIIKGQFRNLKEAIAEYEKQKD